MGKKRTTPSLSSSTNDIHAPFSATRWTIRIVVFLSFHGANHLTSCDLQKAALRKAHVGDSRSYPLVNQDSCEKSPSSKTWNDHRTQWPICTIMRY